MAEAGAISYHSSIKRRTSGSALWTILCACTLLGAASEGIVNSDGRVVNSTNDEGMIVYAKPFITARNSHFGAKIEGTSVDSFGRVYAVDFQNQKSQLGQLSDAFGDEEQRLFFKLDDENSQFNGIRFFPVPLKNSELASAALVADKKGQVLQVLHDKAGVVRARVFCKNETMIEPNDLAVAYKSGRLYSTGLNSTPTTTHGDGDIWLCKIPQNGALFPANVSENGTVAEAVRMNVQGRANGIEFSCDEEHLYASETWVKDMKIYSNVVWKYDIDAATGNLSNKKLFFDMKAIDEELQGEGGDIDGLRTDMAGNLYIVRNGELGEVVKVSAEGEIVKRVKLEGVTEPTNIELAGPYGTVLFIVGKCKENLQKGCVDVWENDDAPGRAFFNLWRPVLQPFELVLQYNHRSATNDTNQVRPSAPILHYDQSSTKNPHAVRQSSTDNPHEVRQSSTNNPHEVRQSSTNNPHETRQSSTINPNGVRQSSTINPNGVRQSSTNNPHGVRQSSTKIPHEVRQSSTNNPNEVRQPSTKNPNRVRQSSTDNPNEARPILQSSPPISHYNQPSTTNSKESRPAGESSTNNTDKIRPPLQSTTKNTNEGRPISQHSAPASQYNQSSTNNANEGGPVRQSSVPVSQYNQSSTNNANEGRPVRQASVPVSQYNNRSSISKGGFPPGVKFQTEIVIPEIINR